MRRLILRCDFDPGDILMLTAGVRDLHYWYPETFATDVRTRFPELWANNPMITVLSESDPTVDVIECECPLVHRSNQAPFHYLHGFIDFLNSRLNLRIQPMFFKADLYLSAEEMDWKHDHEGVRLNDLPFWILVAGGKRDLTIKWWDHRRFQEVVDHFKDRLLFIQVGAAEDYHPKIKHTIDLRGKTSLRKLIALVYHSQGVVCPVTFLMHLAAAVESKYDHRAGRPCVVVAGGREPPHWEAYPHHQFIHTIGTLPCCARGACWRKRTVRLHPDDRPDELCVDVQNDLPRCMDMITAEDVIRRIELYLIGGALGRTYRESQPPPL